MRNISFLTVEGLEPINIYEKKYWHRMLLNNIKVGAEIECSYESSCPRRQLQEALKPTDSYSEFGDNGINEVKGDGSLVNGVEITTVGRRVSFLELYNQYKFITDNIFQHDPNMDSHAGFHNHILLDYNDYSNSLEVPFNPLIFKNFVQLLRRHFPEICYITSTVKPTPRTKPTAMTRNTYFSDHSTLMSTTIHDKTIADIQRKIINGSRYRSLNLYPLNARDNTIKKLHVELRFPDGSIYPAQMAAQNILYTAMLLKACELSEIGMLGTGDDWEETKRLANAFRNAGEHVTGNRCSYAPSEEDLAKIKERAQDMLIFLKPSICAIEPKVMPILKSLAEKPISLMRREMTDVEVNEYFHSIVSTTFKDNTDMDILKLIASCSITGANSQENWCYKVSEKLGKDYKVISESVKTMGTLRNLKFDYEVGGVVEF